jgi:hypothetical protein
MLLHINKDRKIEFYDIVDDDSKIIKGVVEHYNGEFNFFMGDYIEGKEKEFYLSENGTICIEYVDIEPQEEPPLTETEQAILDTAINVDYLVCMKELEI